MLPLDRLVVLMLIGALLGFVTFAGLAEKSYEALAGAILGALGGLVVDLVCRVAARPSWRFTIRDLFIALTLAGIILGAVVTVFRWISPT